MPLKWQTIYLCRIDDSLGASCSCCEITNKLNAVAPVSIQSDFKETVSGAYLLMA